MRNPFKKKPADKPTKPHEVTLRMSDRAKDRFDHLMKVTEAPDAGHMLRNAMRLYDAIIQEHEDGNKLAIIKPDGTVTQYDVFHPETV